LLSAASVAWRLLVDPAPVSALLVVDSGAGLLINSVHALILRFRGVHLYISHHTFLYVDKTSALMEAFIACAGERVTHLFLCSCMREKFSSRYLVPNSLILNNARRVEFDDAQASGSGNRKKFSIGYISNVSFEKGIREYFQTLDLLSDLDIEWIIAGPPASLEVEEYLRREVAQRGVAVQWIGPVYGAEKARFLEQISVLLFPTRYAVEAQPNVLFEALSFGVPVVSTPLGCIEEDMRGSGSSVIPDSDFPPAAAKAIRAFFQVFSRGEWAGVERTANKKFVELRGDAKLTEQELLDQLLRPQSRGLSASS